MQEPRINLTAAVDSPQAKQAIRTFEGEFSHDDSLVLGLKVKHDGWLRRTLSVTTKEPIWYRDAIIHIAVPAGFTYDLASIPRVFWVLIAPHEIALESTFHDLLYRDQQVSRQMADAIFLSMMAQRKVPWLIRWAVYLAVRSFGGKAWHERTAQVENARLAAIKLARKTNQPIEIPSTLAPDAKQ